MRTLFRIPLLILALLPCVPVLPAAQISESGDARSFSVIPEAIQINAFYKGTDVIASADLPADCDGAVVKIQGESEEVTLRRKGRVSIFWLNVDDVTVSEAPDIYILNSSAPLETICDSDMQHLLLLGYNALKQHIGIRGEKSPDGTEFPEFIKLKEHYGAYRQTETAQLKPGTARNSFEAVLHIPPVMPSGDYRVQLFYFKDRLLQGTSETKFKVEKIGVPKYLYSLAFDHAAFYGVFACVIAMATGIIMGLIFGSRSRRKR
jgi:uncharacterized protein (TIGR02186 family)